MYNKKSVQKEKGIALIMAIFVALFLLAVSLAYIVCSKNNLNQSHLSQGKINGIVAAEAGMERALWFLQERADAAQEIPEGKILGDYDELLKNYKDKTKATKDGVIILGMGTNTRYAVMTAYEEDDISNGTVTNGKELAIYAIAVTRQANTMGGEVSNIKAMKMLVRIGAREGGMIEVVFGGKGEIRQLDNSQWQIKGKIYTEEGFVQNAEPIDYHEVDNSSLYPKRDGFLNDTNVELQGPWTNTITPISGAATLTRGSMDKQTLPDINVADFASTKGSYGGYDYAYQDLIEKGWYVENGALIKPVTQPIMSIWSNPPGTVTNGTFTLNTDDPWVQKIMVGCYTTSDNLTKSIFYDINGDGYTTIYLGPGTPNLRIMPGKDMDEQSIEVKPGARGIIASQGMGNNYTVLPDGISTWGAMSMGADIQENNTVGVEIRGQIVAGRGSSIHPIYKEESTGVPSIWTFNVGDGYYRPIHALMGDNWGALSILSDNDVIISESGLRASAPNTDGGGSNFRGFVYSKNNLKIQSDILFQGMMIGVNSANIADPAASGEGMGRSCNGWDPSLYYEDALHPTGGMSFFPNEMAPSSSVANSRKMTVLSWEADKFYKKKI